MTDLKGVKVRQPAKQDPKAARQEVELIPAIMRACGGSEIDDFNTKLLNDTVSCVRVPDAPDGDHGAASRRLTMAMVAAMGAFKPKDEIEGMLAAQAVALHNTAMECLRRSMIPGQPPDVASKLRKDGTNMARAMTDMLAALDRKRGKGQQHIRVERVMVGEGGQAIVGNVTTGVPAASMVRVIEKRDEVPMEPIAECERVGGAG